jgi:hypothetical protein
MARPGASCLEKFSLAVGFPKWCLWNAGPACQVWARECWNIGMMDFKGNKRLFLLFPNIPGFQYSKPRRGYPGRSKAGGMAESLPAISKSDLSSFRFLSEL